MIRIAIVGTGGMAGSHAETFAKIPGCQIVAGCDIDEARAAAFCARHAIPKSYGNLDRMLKEVGIDAVVNVTPDAAHAPVSLKVIAAGKHILCEKPLAVDHAEAATMVAAARKRGVINMVNFSYRRSSAVQKARQLVAAGKLGKIVHVDAAYLQGWLVSTIWGNWRTSPGLGWRLSTRHGSKGVLGDLGVHIVDFASYVAGDIKAVTAQLKVFPALKGKKIGPYTLDANDTALISAEYENGAVGQIQTSRWATGHVNTVRLLVCGTKGAVRIDLDKGYDKLEVCFGTDVKPGLWKEITCPATPDNQHRFIRSIRTGKNDQPDFARGAVVQKILDACFVSDAGKKRVKI